MPTGGLRIELHIRYWINKQRTHFEVHKVFLASSMDEFFPSPPTQNLIENPANERQTATLWTTSPTVYEQCVAISTSQKIHLCKGCETGTTVYHPSPRRKCSCQQMSLQRQHFLLSWFKTLSVGQAEV